MDKVCVLKAIAIREGFYVIGSRPNRNHNPGDLIYGAEAISFGANAHDAGYSVFTTDDKGWTALKRWLSVKGVVQSGKFTYSNGVTIEGKLLRGYLGGTIEQVFYRFAPPDDHNDTEGYIIDICNMTGLSRKTILTEDLLVLPS